MKWSEYFIPTLKEAPLGAEAVSHQLLLRAGLVHMLISGVYSYLPLGLKVLRRVENIIREEMEALGARELLLPCLQPIDLWKKTGRDQTLSDVMIKFEDNRGRAMCLGPTHEEVITDLVQNFVQSYRQLPVVLYQIQTKFRDEIRPRVGIMRAREFIMKDAYSFHINAESLQETYEIMYSTYSKIFSRIGLEFRPVQADTGSIGGSGSHEFHVLADSGEDAIAFSDESDYAANVEMAEALTLNTNRPAPTQTLQTVGTPGQHSIDQVSTFLKVDPSQTVKTLLVDAKKYCGLNLAKALNDAVEAKLG